MFTQVNYNSNLNNIVARVNRRTGELQINPNIWKYLNDNEKKFVILHEQGHLRLDTRSEFEANNYAKKQYIKSAIIRDDNDFEREIAFITEISKRNEQWDNMAIDPVTAVANAVGDIFSFLSISGIGSKARRKETQTQAQSQIDIYNAQNKLLGEQSKRKTETIIIIFVAVLVLLVVILVFIKAKK